MIPAMFQQEPPKLEDRLYTAADVDRAIERRNYPVIARAFDALVAASQSGTIDVELLRRAARALIEFHDPNWPVESFFSDRAYAVLQGRNRDTLFGRQHQHAALYLLDNFDAVLSRIGPNSVPDE